ncbi:haloacid dehalogenase type II [bacterium]|nr:haloacid dehalogenase type II [bacterium]
MPLRAIAFDAYGTLFDVFSIGSLAEELFPGQGARIAMVWRDKQIEYTRVRTLCDRYADFWQVTQDALDYTCDLLGQSLTAADKARLMGQYARLAAFPEVVGVLQRLKAAALPMAILSNGTPAMLDQAVGAAGLGGVFDHILSADAVRRFKTAPEAYRMGPDTFGCPAGEILFVSCNGWDICGATWFGYRTFWLNRHGLPAERLGVTPDRTGTSLAEVADFALSLRDQAAQVG